MKNKEFDFMADLHRTRARLAKAWAKMSDKEFLAHMHRVGKKFRQSAHPRKTFAASRP